MAMSESSGKAILSISPFDKTRWDIGDCESLCTLGGAALIREPAYGRASPRQQAADSPEEKMARTQYFIVLHEDEWNIKLGNKHYGPYKSRTVAIRAAVEAANQDGVRGNGAQVLVQGDDQKFRTEWTYSHDPYPPRG
jgi:hypothetical protein